MGETFLKIISNRNNRHLFLSVTLVRLKKQKRNKNKIFRKKDVQNFRQLQD